MTIQERAVVVRRLERIYWHTQDQYCREEYEGDFLTGDGGCPPCRRRLKELALESESPCIGCEAQLAGRKHVRPALNRAKRRLRTAIDRHLGHIDKIWDWIESDGGP